MIITAETYHVPVLLQECVDGLDIQPDGIYIDVTFGGGGHSREILRRLGRNGHLYGFDQDGDAEGNIVDDDRFTFIRSNFRYIRNWMRYYGVEGVDGVLADLGVSSHHFDDVSRGFSFRFDAPLDMRMNKRGGMTAADVVNDYTEEQLADVLYLYGELKQARRLAAAIVKARGYGRLTTTQDLIEVIRGTRCEVIRGTRYEVRGTRNDSRREVRGTRGDSRCEVESGEKKDLARVFQALRIEVNHEMVALREMLNGAQQLLRKGGRLSVITYHSLEDRIVKNMMRTGNAEGRAEQDFFGRTMSPLRAVNNRVIEATAEEVERNPRSRSAKLRIGEKR